MKKALLTLFITIALASLSFAQTGELVVPSTDDDGNPIINALSIYVVADTNAAGEQNHAVYKLENGAFYFYNESPVFTNPITLTTVNPYHPTEASGKPAKLMVTWDDEGTAPYADCIHMQADLKLENIAFMTTSTDMQYTWANAVVVQRPNLRLELKNCLFELTGWGIIEANIEGTSIFADQIHVRNGVVIPGGNEWCPFFFEIDAGSCDTLKVVNSTFFNLQGTVVNVNVQNRIKFMQFDHNTFVNNVKGLSSATAHEETYITNNIFYNFGTHGQTHANINANPDPGVINGLIMADTMQANVPNAPDSLIKIMDEADRKLAVRNNVYFMTQGVRDYEAAVADSVDGTPWMNSITANMFADKETWPLFEETNTVIMDPQFIHFDGTDGMVEQLLAHRQTGVFGEWGWDPDEDEFPDYHWAMVQWPLPEDFKTQNPSLPLGTDGFPVGSLQWFREYLDEYVTDVNEETEVLPNEFSLKQNYPNPFNPTTNIKFTLAEAGDVNLKIYNSIGQEVLSVVNSEFLAAGLHHKAVDMSAFSSGVYFYRLSQNNNVQVQKMVLMK